MIPSYFQRPPPWKTDLKDPCFPRNSGNPLQNAPGVPAVPLLPWVSGPSYSQRACCMVVSLWNQAKIGKYTFTYFFHNRLKFNFGTIWRILFLVLSIILAENFRENLWLDLKYFGSLKEYSSTSNSSILTVSKLKEYTDKCVFASQLPHYTSTLVLIPLPLTESQYCYPATLYNIVIYNLALRSEKFPFLIWKTFASLPKRTEVLLVAMLVMKMTLICFNFTEKLHSWLTNVLWLKPYCLIP